MAGRQQGMDGGVSGPRPIGEPVSSRPGRTAGVLGRGRLRIGFGSCRSQGAEAAAVLGDAPLGGFAQVVPQVPPVRDLDGLRSADSGALGKERGTVPADDLDVWSPGEPRGQAGRLPVGQQIDRAAGFDVHENGAVVPALAGGVLIDPNHSRRGRFRLRKRVDQAQDSAPAGGCAEDGRQAGAGPACQGETYRGQCGAQPLSALAVPAGQPGYLLHEGPTRTPAVPADEPADPQPEYNAPSSTRHISGKPQVGAVNTVRPCAAGRAHGALHSAPRVNAHYRDIHVNRQHHDVGDRREQHLLQPEPDLFHGSELSAIQDHD